MFILHLGRQSHPARIIAIAIFLIKHTSSLSYAVVCLLCFPHLSLILLFCFQTAYSYASIVSACPYEIHLHSNINLDFVWN